MVAEPAHALLPRRRRAGRGLRGHLAHAARGGLPADGGSSALSGHPPPAAAGVAGARRSSSRCITSRSGSTTPTRRRQSCCAPLCHRRTGIPGLLALEPARHAVVLAVHAWAHVPLGAALPPRRRRRTRTASSDRESWLASLAAWNVDRLWRTTQATIDSLFGDRRRPLVGHLWARHLWDVRERTVLERHVERWLAPFSALPPARAAGADQAAPRTSVRPGGRRDAPANDEALRTCGGRRVQAPFGPRRHHSCEEQRGEAMSTELRLRNDDLAWRDGRRRDDRDRCPRLDVSDCKRQRRIAVGARSPQARPGRRSRKPRRRLRHRRRDGCRRRRAVPDRPARAGAAG